MHHGFISCILLPSINLQPAIATFYQPSSGRKSSEQPNYFLCLYGDAPGLSWMYYRIVLIINI